MKIIITGGTKGIGRAIAEKFASHGFDIAICARTQADLDQMEKAFTTAYPTIKTLFAVADMQDRKQVEAFADLVTQNWGPLDVIVNNAGVFLPGEIHEEEDGLLERMIETNLYSAYHLTRRLLPEMLPRQAGHIFNICSVASLKAYPNGGSYSISKYALLGFSQNLREELKEKGVRVTAVMPGATWSASWAGVELPEERLMPAKDIASAIYNAWTMSPATVVEDIVLRPQLGDL